MIVWLFPLIFAMSSLWVPRDLWGGSGAGGGSVICRWRSPLFSMSCTRLGPKVQNRSFRSPCLRQEISWSHDPDSFSFGYAIKHFFLTTIMEPVFCQKYMLVPLVSNLNPYRPHPGVGKCASVLKLIFFTLTVSHSLRGLLSYKTSYSRGGGYSHTLPIRVCAAQRGRDFEAPGLERGIHFRGVF